jgi:hypothetical protein
MTGATMCTAISTWLEEKHGITKTPREVWNSSPSGELWPLYEMYEGACADGYVAVDDPRFGSPESTESAAETNR